MVGAMIIGITGKAGSGKDTAADILVDGFGFRKISLADPMKRAVMDWFGFSHNQLWGPSEMRNAPDKRYVRVPAHEEPCFRTDEWGHSWEKGTAYVPDQYLTPRHALQQLGTEFGRACYQDVWIDFAIRTAKRVLAGQAYTPNFGLELYESMNPARGVVIPDVRFANELAAIRKAGGRVFRIERQGAGLTGVAAAHASEREQEGFTDADVETIRNDGTLEDLATALRWAINSEL